MRRRTISKVTNKTARNGVSSRVANEMVARLAVIRALWFAVHNDPGRSIDDLAREFYFAVGEALEGRPLATIALTNINRARANSHSD
jgi:hypothetical protein